MTTAARPGAWAFGLALVVAALNLRPAITSLSPLMPELRATYGLTELTTVLVIALPVLVLGLGSVLAPVVAARLGARRTVTVGLLAVAAGIGVRSVVRGAVFPGTVLAALGITLVAVMLPAVVRDRGAASAGAWTAVYGVAMAVGASAAPTVTGLLDDRGVPVLVSTGGWAAVALVSAVAWHLLAGGRSPVPAAGSVPRPAHTRVTPAGAPWLLAALFGVQALLFFAIVTWLPRFARDSGLSVGQAGGLLGLFSVVGCVGSLLVPLFVARLRAPFVLLMALSAGSLAGFGALAAGWPPVVGTVLLGLGQAGVFPLVITLFVSRAADSAVAATLSARSQSVGFTGAAIGLVALAVLHQAQPSWPAFWLLLTALVVVQVLIGSRAAVRDLVRPSGSPPSAASLRTPQVALTQGELR
ncbi:MFS transporter [Nocardioides jejuensis]|uniref:MFS transporter n=1 Tax=Nocardioides jejuensis TaxID=2502782 RepID=A0A4R1CH49_9ACTN|nr:MFS transporter [Nocardioides jejuensis]TCJ30489.1 MFS transporter [Nocardioides jejuensis]